MKRVHDPTDDRTLLELTQEILLCDLKFCQPIPLWWRFYAAIQVVNFAALNAFRAAGTVDPIFRISSAAPRSLRKVVTL